MEIRKNIFNGLCQIAANTNVIQKDQGKNIFDVYRLWGKV